MNSTLFTQRVYVSWVLTHSIVKQLKTFSDYLYHGSFNNYCIMVVSIFNGSIPESIYRRRLKTFKRFMNFRSSWNNLSKFVMAQMNVCWRIHDCVHKEVIPIHCIGWEREIVFLIRKYIDRENSKCSMLPM